jgi:hypothetical protein
MRCKAEQTERPLPHTHRAEHTRLSPPISPAARRSRDRQSPIGARGTERAGWHGWLKAGGVDSEVVGPVPVPEDVGIHPGLVESVM